MFGIGGSEILVILIVALLFLGPDKLPDAAKQISKGIRDLKKQSRVLQQTIENDEHIGGAIRDLKSALRGDEVAPRPVVKKKVGEIENKILGEPAAALAPAESHPDAGDEARAPDLAAQAINEAAAAKQPHADPLPPTLPALVGEPDAHSFHLASTLEADELASLIKKPAGETAARGQAAGETGTRAATAPGIAATPDPGIDDSKLKHG